eukprot:6177224-Pleurochrysis_carterae.AAC.1
MQIEEMRRPKTTGAMRWGQRERTLTRAPQRPENEKQGQVQSMRRAPRAFLGAAVDRRDLLVKDAIDVRLST